MVVPVDFSDASHCAINAALEMVARPADVHAVHVIQPAQDRDLIAEWSPRQPDETWDGAALARLDEYLRSHDSAGVTQAVCLGDPGLAITDYAREHDADLIIIPSHGYHGLKRLLLGSVAEHVVRYATCPVLVLRRPDAEPTRELERLGPASEPA